MYRCQKIDKVDDARFDAMYATSLVSIDEAFPFDAHDEAERNTSAKKKNLFKRVLQFPRGNILWSTTRSGVVTGYNTGVRDGHILYLRTCLFDEDGRGSKAYVWSNAFHDAQIDFFRRIRITRIRPLMLPNVSSSITAVQFYENSGRYNIEHRRLTGKEWALTLSFNIRG